MLRDLFKDEISEESINGVSLEERIRILELSEHRVQDLKNMPVKQLDKYSYIDAGLEEIETDKIVGLARPFFGNNWLDVLSQEYCHKLKNFIQFNYDTFDSVLQCEDLDDYPCVVEYQGEYYISDDGLHRLTIAKCIGNKKAKVVVQR